MLRTYATPLRLDIKSSRIYLIYIATVVSMALLALFFLPINIGLIFLLFICAVFFSVREFLNYNSVKLIIWKHDNQWEIIGNKKCLAELLPGSRVFPWLTVLNFKLENGCLRSVVIFPDSIATEQFRQLRVRLKVSSNKLFKKTCKDLLN